MNLALLVFQVLACIGAVTCAVASWRLYVRFTRESKADDRRRSHRFVVGETGPEYFLPWWRD